MRVGSTPPPCHVSHDMYHVSCVTCHKSHVIFLNRSVVALSDCHEVKTISDSPWDGEKFIEAVLLHLFTLAFTASLPPNCANQIFI